MTLDYYYGDQAEQFSFYRIPKLLFTDKRFKDLSAEAKILYGLLLDRMSLSAKNGWLDQEGRVYIVYTVEDIMDALSCASQKAMKLLNELDEKRGLIERKRQGLGKPNLIYVKNFVSAPESKFKNGENQNSELLKIETQEFPKSKGSNTEKNNTDFNDTESLPFPSFRGGQKRESKGNDAERRAQYRELIIENISYDVLLVDLPYDKEIVEEILELIVDTVCTTKETVRISGDDKPAEVVRSRFLKLDSEHIRFVVSCMKENTTKIKNIRQYLLATLYTNLQRENISPMERAQAYKMKMEALKHQGQRTDLTSTQVGRKLETAEIIAQQTGESKNQVRRFVRLTELVPELQTMVDKNELAFNPAVEISYLSKDEQKGVLDTHLWISLTLLSMFSKLWLLPLAQVSESGASLTCWRATEMIIRGLKARA